MIGDATLKLLVGLAVGIGVYYNYKKQKVKKTRLDDPIMIGKAPPMSFSVSFGLNTPKHKHEEKQNSSLTPTNQIPMF